MLDQQIREQLDALEKLVRYADEHAERAPKRDKRAKRQRNAINAACNAMFRASRI